MRNALRVTLLTFTFIGVLATAGCEQGPAVAPVTGIVTQDGEPVFQAMVEFQPETGAPSYGYTDENGRYEVKYQLDRMGALLGRHRIKVNTVGEVTDPKTDMTVNRPETVPEEWNDESENYFEVKRGKNVYDIKIVGKRERRGRKRN